MLSKVVKKYLGSAIMEKVKKEVGGKKDVDEGTVEGKWETTVS